MAAGPLSVAPNTSTNNDGILIGDRVYSEVYLTISNSLIPEERLQPTPSMLDGLDLHTETDLRILGCELIQSAGILLRLPQVAMATGQVLFHRFFYSKSFVKHSFEIVAMACVNLASKIEEAPRRFRDVINVFHHLKQSHRGKRSASSLILDQNYINTKNQVIKAERRILKELGFCVHVKHPHKIIVMYLQVLECEKNQTLVQTAWNYMNDSLRTNVFVRFQAETIACACIYLAARALQMPLPSRPHWYLLFGATEEEIKDICITTLKLYTRKKSLSLGQPDYDHLEKEVEKMKMSLQEAKLKAKGLNPDGTPALSNLGGFSPGSKPCSPNVVKVEDKSPNPQALKPVKKEPDSRAQGSKSPHNGLRKEAKIGRNSRSRSGSLSRTRSRSRSPRRHYNSRRSRSGTYSSRSRSRSHSRSPSPDAIRPPPSSFHTSSQSPAAMATSTPSHRVVIAAAAEGLTRGRGQGRALPAKGRGDGREGGSGTETAARRTSRRPRSTSTREVGLGEDITVETGGSGPGRTTEKGSAPTRANAIAAAVDTQGTDTIAAEPGSGGVPSTP
ncbi:cyclin-L1 isoform X2 [Coregonus clupeaformis]|uniref:cyclin-L1 isoform X2 n=1 Tax=Coregonus clupeaformis TaxID=59861 RepID=UPI001E1C326C|nr:cyclin-L1 isoform X2 [Coregonus clupeaformis]